MWFADPVTIFFNVKYKMSEAEKKKQMSSINGIFQMNVKSGSGKEGTWTIDFKKVRKQPALFQVSAW